jgi:hypothetical protein
MLDCAVGERGAEVDDEVLELGHARELRDEMSRVGLGRVRNVQELELDGTLGAPE